MFTRTESFSEYIRFYPIVTIFLFINISHFPNYVTTGHRLHRAKWRNGYKLPHCRR